VGFAVKYGVIITSGPGTGMWCMRWDYNRNKNTVATFDTLTEAELKCAEWDRPRIENIYKPQLLSSRMCRALRKNDKALYGKDDR